MTNNTLNYTKPELEVISFNYADIIATSSGCSPVYPCANQDGPSPEAQYKL